MTTSNAITWMLGALLTMNPGQAALAQDQASNKDKNRAGVPARRGDLVEDYHGVKVADPYRWLEDLDSPETRAWIEAENQLTSTYLAEIPARPRIKERLEQLWNYEKYGVPRHEGDRYFYTRNAGLQNQSVLYTTPSLEGDPRVLLDPNTLSNDGTVALAGTAVSDDGKLLAYGLATAGSDWNEWRVRDVDTGRDLDDHLQWIKFSGASWTKDGLGFFYGRFPAPAPDQGADLKQPNYYQKLYYHKIGTPQASDVLVYERPEQKEWEFHGDVTEDGQYLIITVSKGTDSKWRILYKNLAENDSKVVTLIDNFKNEYAFINNDGPVFWFKTNKDAPRGRVVAIDNRHPEPEHWSELIPQAADTLVDVNMVNDQFITSYLKDAHTQVNIFDVKGKLVRKLQLPGLGSASGFGGKRKDKETFYSFTSFTTPTTIYRYDMTTGESQVFRRPKVDFNPDDYQTEQVFYVSKDGTRIPMFLSSKKGLKRDGGNPTNLYGYGGFNIPLTPAFSPANLVWMELGGLYAQPNLRGGGEYGEEWHQAGTKLKKQNVFDDFIAAAEWLIDHKYTSKPKLAISGRSNGGLLVGACITQRPDLFGATLPGVGVMDMLRFHKFTIGWAWVDDYGSADNPEQFKALAAYSPLHNIKPGTTYPATLVTTADHDDRVFPAHSFKFTAELQAAQAGDAPILIRIETRAGHGAGTPTSKLIDEAADRWAFLVRTLDIALPANP
jgi:prolyl oligopeptidase